MRIKDEKKLENIYEATLQLIIDEGLHQTSISKIAKGAGVSPATIYIYFENKEDLINKLYLSVKKEMSDYIFVKIDNQQTVHENFVNIMKKFSQYIQDNKSRFLFVEQLQNMPILSSEILDQTNQYFYPMEKVLKKGISEQVIKDIDTKILFLPIFQPLSAYFKEQFNSDERPKKAVINILIELAWNSISI
ncbi:hypothetical protein BG262_05090 [Floricoccus penangensis]|uniref:HTH tetR-type domain-containing protein n=1 Tax=Floricoccus penangensis TaxID=1859475 RepID=A0A9Q5JFJ4_9LACT|nr:TetR/AcrR family transcriptional regulator [Floricoccus penangensis]OFI46393.1 hypothetical protein BG262_05090 [Floricoccus penangensis]